MPLATSRRRSTREASAPQRYAQRLTEAEDAYAAAARPVAVRASVLANTLVRRYRNREAR
jgi:NAD(P)H-dependent flavin oxidoreductase YrpB (nitropropane dioxygenase family)